MTFEWDEHKAVRNLARHGIRFSEAVTVFADPRAFEFVDEEHSTENEVRYGIIGFAVPGMLFVAFTEPAPDRIRIIHARRAEPWMVRKYEQQEKKI